MTFFQAHYGPPKKTQAEAEIWSASWVEQLADFDRQTLIDNAKAVTGRFKFWPSLAEFKIMCAEDRKHMAESVGLRRKWSPGPPPDEDQRAIAYRKNSLALNARVRELMAEASEPMINWYKNHTEEFARQAPYVGRARKELGYVD